MTYAVYLNNCAKSIRFSKEFELCQEIIYASELFWSCACILMSKPKKSEFRSYLANNWWKYVFDLGSSYVRDFTDTNGE